MVVTEETLAEVRRARDVVDVVLSRGDAAYGLNTGLGAFSRRAVSEEELDRFAIATVADQTAAYGRQLPQEVVRATMLSRANTMAKGGVGVRRELLLALVDLLNAGVHPIVREFGSVGESDLYEMADIGKVLIGRPGRPRPGPHRRPGPRPRRLSPMRLAPKEALPSSARTG